VNVHGAPGVPARIDRQELRRSSAACDLMASQELLAGGVEPIGKAVAG
jgi:hypothetical protein